MGTVFDIYSIVLLAAALSMFVLRYVKSEPPVAPYLVIACSCAVGNWLGEVVSPFAGLCIMIAASFLFLSCLLYPHVRRMGQDPAEGIRREQEA